MAEFAGAEGLITACEPTHGNLGQESLASRSLERWTGDAALQWKEPAKSAVKKATSAVDQHKKKLAKQASSAAVEEEARKQRLKNLEEAKKVVIKQDPSLPEARKLRIDDKKVQLGEGDKKGERVKVSGRIHRLRPQKQAVSSRIDKPSVGDFCSDIITG